MKNVSDLLLLVVVSKETQEFKHVQLLTKKETMITS